MTMTVQPANTQSAGSPVDGSTQNTLDALKDVNLLDELGKDVDLLLAGGRTSQPNRADDIPAPPLPSIKSGYQRVSPGDPGTVVLIHPNSDSCETCSAPLISGVPIFSAATGFQVAIGPNPLRREVTIRNVGTTNLFLIFGVAAILTIADITTHYHMNLAPGEAWSSDLWRGEIDVSSDANGGLVSAFEFSPGIYR